MCVLRRPRWEWGARRGLRAPRLRGRLAQLSEVLTDGVGPGRAWVSKKGVENADACNWNYVSPVKSAGRVYNVQLKNNGKTSRW